jgi:hypothetical protein
VYKKLNFGNSQKKASRSVILISLVAERCRIASRPACSKEPLACCKNKTEGKNMNQISNLDKELGTPATITLFQGPGFKGTHKKSKGLSWRDSETRGGMIVDLPFAPPLPPEPSGSGMKGTPKGAAMAALNPKPSKARGRGFSRRR